MGQASRSARVRASVITIAALILFADLHAQTRDSRVPATTPAAAGGVLAGQVVAADTGRPLRRARVTATGGAPQISRSVETDEQGGFRIAGLPPGDYTLSATRGGFVPSIFGQKVPGSGRPGTPITLAAAQEISKISLAIARGGVLTGQIVDEVGEPAFGIFVRAYRRERRQGERVLQAAGSGTTDDRGIYRIPSLLPGEYVVVAQPGSTTMGLKFEEGESYRIVMEKVAEARGEESRVGKIEIRDAVVYADESESDRKTAALATLYYPGTPQSAAASPIPLGPGEERAGVDLQLQTVPVGSVGGVVSGPDGPLPRTAVQLIDHGQVPGMGVRSASTRADGTFTFTNVPPGQYSLVARAIPKGGKQLEASGREAAEFLASAKDAVKAASIAAAINGVAPMWGHVEVNADGRDLTGLQLLMQPGLTLSGRVVLSGSAPGSAGLTRMSLVAKPVGLAKTFDSPALPPAPVDAAGRFTLRGLAPGRYTIAVAAGAPSGFTLQSVMVGGQDVLDFPLEITGREQVPDAIITLGNTKTELSGTALDLAGRPTSAVTVIAFSVEDRFWTPGSRRIQAVRPGVDGRYVFHNFPPGDYRVAIVDDVEPGQWFEADYLRVLANFTVHSVR